MRENWRYSNGGEPLPNRKDWLALHKRGLWILIDWQTTSFRRVCQPMDVVLFERCGAWDTYGCSSFWY